jgi:hypothetical protein
MELTLVRSRADSNDQETFGQLVAGDLVLQTVEQPWKDNLIGHSCVPVGTYTVHPHASPTKGNVYILDGPAQNVYAEDRRQGAAPWSSFTSPTAPWSSRGASRRACRGGRCSCTAPIATACCSPARLSLGCSSCWPGRRTRWRSPGTIELASRRFRSRRVRSGQLVVRGDLPVMPARPGLPSPSARRQRVSTVRVPGLQRKAGPRRAAAGCRSGPSWALRSHAARGTRPAFPGTLEGSVQRVRSLLLPLAACGERCP